MSWLNLSDNLSNLSGNFSSITGQISNFTREVLTESTEEVFDQDAENKLAKLKVKDLEGRLSKQRAELERINSLNEELREKADSAELQIQALTFEYRGVIETKEREIKDLKSTHNEPRSDLSVSRDDMDYEDSEFFQMTVDKLTKQLQEVRAECQHWKEAAKNQNNQAELQSIKEEHQHEVASMQSMYSQRISQMNKNHKSELEDLIAENEKLSKTCAELENENDLLSRSAGSKNANDEHAKYLEEKCKKLNLDFEIKKKQLENLQSQMLEEKKSKKAIQEENSSLNEENMRNLEVITDLKQEIEILGCNSRKNSLIEVDTEPLHDTKSVKFETESSEKLEEVDRIWRKKFDAILHDLNDARDENVELSLEISQHEEKFNELEGKNKLLTEKVYDYERENRELRIQNDKLIENASDLERLKDDISRLGSCTADLLEELEFQKGLSCDQNIEIESLRKICTIKGSPAEEIKQMQKSLKELGRRYVELYQHYKKVSFELRKSNDRLLAERQLRHTCAVQLREEVSSACQRLKDTADAKLNICQEETSSIRNELTDLNRQVDRREQIVSELEMDVDYVSDQTAKIVSEIGCQVRQSDLVSTESSEAETIDSLIAEKEILERTIEGLERKAGALEELVASLQDSHANRGVISGSAKDSDISTCNSDTEQERMLGSADRRTSETANKHPEMFRPLSIAESVSTDGFYIDDEHPRDSKTFATNDAQNNRQKRVINELEATVLEKEKELFELNAIKHDLEFEKTTLEKVVLDLQKQLKVARETPKMADTSHNATQLSHQESATDISSLDWDSLVEAKDSSLSLKAELELTKSELESVSREIKELFTILPKDFECEQGVLDEVRDTELPSIDQMKKLINDVKHSFSGFASKTTELKATIEASKNDALLLDKAVDDILIFVFDAWNQRTDRIGSMSNFHAGTCVEKLRNLRSVLENFILEYSGETDADKWRSLHDEVCAERGVIVEELTRAKDSVRVLKEKHRDLTEENTSLLETVDLLRQDLELMSQGQSALAAERELLQTELDKLQFQIDTNETDDSKEIGELKMQLDDLKIERERIMKMVNQRDDFITEQQEKHDHLVDQVVEEKDRDLLEIQEQLEETMALFKEKQKQCEALEEANERLKENGDGFKSRALELEKELSLLSKEKDSLQLEVNDRRFKANENEVLMKSLEQADEELREKEILEEDMLREQEILIDELRSENVYLRNELNSKNTVLNQENKQDNLDVDNQQIVLDRISKLEAEKEVLGMKNTELMDEIADFKTVVEGLKEKLCRMEEHEARRTSPTIELNGDLDGGIEESERGSEYLFAEEDSLSNRKDTLIMIEEPVKATEEVVMEMEPDVNNEEKQLVEDYVKQQERLRQLEIEIEAYKGYERKVDEKENEIERSKAELSRMMQVLRSKDELLLNLEMMEGEQANDDSPFSSRARVIQYIRDKEMELSYTQEKMRSLEELIKHNTNQLELLKVERQNLLIFMKRKEAETIDLNERLENVQARSAAKEHASAVLHSEHKKMLELNSSQGSEIARLRERNQYLQNVLQEKQSQSANESMLSKRNQQLEIQIAAFQQEQERLLTLIHQKDKYNVEITKKIQDLESQIDLVKNEGQVMGNDVTKESDRHFATAGGEDKNIDVNEEEQFTEEAGKILDSVDAASFSDNLESPLKLKPRSGLGDAKDNLDPKMKRSGEKNIIYEREIQDYKQQLDMLNKNNSKLTKDYNEIKQKLDLVENEKNNVRTKLDDEIRGREIAAKDGETRVDELKRRIVEVTQNFEQERVRNSQHFDTRTNLLVKEWEEKLRVKDDELKSLLEKLELLETVKEQVQKSDKSSNKTVTQIETLTVENRKLRSLYEEKKNEISVLQGDVHRLKNVAAASEAALNKIQTDNRYIIDQSIKKDSQLEELSTNRTLATQRIQELETEVHRLTVNCREVEAKAAKEMERFRNHLIAIEEGYTNEAVTARDREVELEEKVAELQGLFQQRKSEYEETSNQSSFQIQNLQQQLFAVANQRDNAVTKLTQAQEKAHQSESALYNLQSALEQFQKEKDSQYEMLAEQSKKKLMTADKEIEDLRKKENSFQARIQEATLAVQGVANLSNEVNAKNEQIDALKSQVSALEMDANSKTEFIKKLKDSTEGKIEKPLMKNLLIGYFHTPEAKRPEVVRVIGNLVGFSREEIHEVGSGAPPSQRTWVSSLMPFGGAPKSAARPVQKTESSFASSLSKSFSEMFVSFLEEESGAASRSNRPTANQLTALLMQPPESSSTPVPGKSNENKQPAAIGASMPSLNPLLITPQDARVMQSNAFKTSLPLLPSTLSSSTPLFPAPGQEVPRVHTSTANSALRTMLSK